MMPRLMLVCAVVAFGALAGGAQSTPPKEPAGWTQLFNGHSLDGWEHVGPGSFSIVDGLLKTHGGMGLLWYTREKIGSAVLRVVFQTVRDNSNSGVFIRIPDKPTEPWMPVNKGIEVQIDNSDNDYHCTGVLYSLTQALARPQKKPGEWNTMDITIDGPHTIVVLNGVKVTDYTEGQPVPPKKHSWEPDRGPRPDTGYIGLQNHNDQDVVYFSEVAVKLLPR
ncbi:MAG TPA: DUF1080 domain-containing protein [Terriglobia bacterium]|nr:DUF1080 domain-containing protein [Terriglobia bacterium]